MAADGAVDGSKKKRKNRWGILPLAPPPMHGLAAVLYGFLFGAAGAVTCAVAGGRSGASTLETNLANIDCKELEYQVTTDPLFQKTSAAFDEVTIKPAPRLACCSATATDMGRAPQGGAKGLLLNNLSVYNGCQLVFDSTDAIAPADAPAEPTDDDDVIRDSDDDDDVGHSENPRKCPAFRCRGS